MLLYCITYWNVRKQDRNSIIRRGETGFTTVQLNSRGQKYVTFSYYSNSTQVDYRGVAADAPRLKILIKKGSVLMEGFHRVLGP